jgi:hypothetical protein
MPKTASDAAGWSSAGRFFPTALSASPPAPVVTASKKASTYSSPFSSEPADRRGSREKKAIPAPAANTTTAAPASSRPTRTGRLNSDSSTVRTTASSSASIVGRITIASASPPTNSR